MTLVHSGSAALTVTVFGLMVSLSLGVAVGLSALRTGDAAQGVVSVMALGLLMAFLRAVALVGRRRIWRSPTFGKPIDRRIVVGALAQDGLVCVRDSHGQIHRVAVVSYTAYSANPELRAAEPLRRLTKAINLRG